MTTETVETLPWERYEAETDGDPKVTMFLRPSTAIETFDRLDKRNRVVGLHIGSLTLHISDFDGGDREIIAAIRPLVDALIELHDNAQQRAES